MVGAEAAEVMGAVEEVKVMTGESYFADVAAVLEVKKVAGLGFVDPLVQLGDGAAAVNQK